MKKLLLNINRVGLKDIQDPLDYRRILFVNTVSLVSSIVSFVVTIFILIEQIFPQFYVTASGFILFLLVIVFNHKGWYILSRTYFITLSVSILTTASLIAFEQGRFNEVENILLGFMAVAYLLYDGKVRYLGYIAIFALLILLKFLKQDYMGEPYNLNFYLILQNIIILGLLIFLFANAFRNSLMAAFMKLKAKDEVLYSMIDNVPVFIGLIDNDLRYRMVNLNYQRAFGKERNQIIGSHVSDVLPQNILAVHQPMIQSALEGESPEFLNYTDMPDGSNFYAGGRYVPVRSSDGKIIGTSVFVNDVTKLEEAKNKLKTANKTKDRLFSIIAHDIRGPLDMFETLLSVSSEGLITKEQFFDHQESVKERMSGLRETVNTLLEWARTQLDGINASPTSVKVLDVICENEELYKDFIKKKEIDLRVEIDEEITAWIDENHFKISIRNLIHNALKFTPLGGKVITHASRDSNKILMSIKDSGKGMDKNQIDSILNKELQHSSAGTAGESGTGLGLSLSLELLEKNNCEVEIKSEVGLGTEIKIQIPSHPLE